MSHPVAASGPGRGLTALLCGVLTALMAQGCASWWVDDPPPFERMEIIGEAEVDGDGLLKGDLHADTTIKGVFIGMGAGFVTGASAGVGLAFVAAAGCWIFYPGCLLVFGLVFGAIGGVGGMFVGGVAGGVGGLPSETTERINPILVDLQQSREFPEEMRAALSAAVPNDRQFMRPENQERGRAPPPGAAATEAGVEDAQPSDTPAEEPPSVQPPEPLLPDGIVIGRIEKVKLRQHMSERLSIRIWATMTMTWNLEGDDVEDRECEYEFTSETFDAEDWLLDDGTGDILDWTQLFHDTFSTGIHTLTGWMARDLEAFRTQTELEETDYAPESCFQD